MEQSTAPADARSQLVRSIIDAGKKAFDPTKEEGDRAGDRTEFEKLIGRTGTWSLIQALNALIKPGLLPPWLQQELMRVLTMIPLRPDGVRGTLEFVFAVHPSTTPSAAEEATPQKRGANITTEALAVATKLLTSPPAATTPTAWFAGIAPQLFAFLDGLEGPELMKAAAQVIGFGVLGRRQYGAPGAPGWVTFVAPILKLINPSVALPIQLHGDADDDLVDLSKPKVLTSSDELALALQRLSSLVNFNPTPGLCKRLVDPVLLELWALSAWTSATSDIEERYCKPARSLLQAFLKIAASNQNSTILVKNLLYNGPIQDGRLLWQFHTAPEGGVRIVAAGFGHANANDLDLGKIEQKADALVQLLVASCASDEVSSIFLDLLRRWLESSKTPSGISVLVKETDLTTSDADSSMRDLLELSVLQQMMDKAPDKLITHFDQLLALIAQVLDEEYLAQQPDEVVSVTLSLLNLVITAPTFQRSDIEPKVLARIERTLQVIGDQDRAEISQTSRNLSLLLRYRDELDQRVEPKSTPTDQQVEDRKIYALGMSYITEADAPPPVRSQGLNLLSGLIQRNSAILDIQAILVLLSSLLKEDEDFLVLRAIKMFTLLANKHPKSVTRELIDHYLDSKELFTTDTRLRFGEALLQVVERLGETFASDIAREVSEVLLSIASRRGYRPKTEAKQKRDERMRQLKNKEAEDAWGGDVPDMSDDITEEERARNDIIAQIVSGWESKRGKEDVRMRASALSILSAGIETNIAGVGASLVSTAVDLCVNVLVFEPEPEFGILRRAAIILILTFVKALDHAKEAGRRLGFGLTDQSREDIMRTLQYVSGTDNDGLVQQHARDVVESLENWQIKTLLPESRIEDSSLGQLAGLTVRPDLPQLQASSQRPKIEEIE